MTASARPSALPFGGQQPTDIRLRDSPIEAFLTKPETIVVNEDPLGEAAVSLPTTSMGIPRWARRLVNGDVAGLVLNRNDMAAVRQHSPWRTSIT